MIFSSPLRISPSLSLYLANDFYINIYTEHTFDSLIHDRENINTHHGLFYIMNGFLNLHVLWSVVTVALMLTHAYLPKFFKCLKLSIVLRNGQRCTSTQTLNTSMCKQNRNLQNTSDKYGYSPLPP